MAGEIGKYIIEYKTKHPSSSAEEILNHVKKKWPGGATSIASVSSTLSRAGLSGRVMSAPPAAITTNPAEMEQHDPEESDADALHRINKRYGAMERLCKKLVGGGVPSLIVSGPPGMSKSWTVTEALHASGKKRHDGLENVGGGGPVYELVASCKLCGTSPHAIDCPGTDDDVDSKVTATSPGWYDHISGTCTAVGLYHALWNMRKGGVILLDDCDAIFRDEDSLNLLKIATDSTRERLVSWRKNSTWLAEYEIDKTFDFQGHIVFLTNVDFEDNIQRQNRDTEHFKALIDRALYLCLTLRTARDFMLKIRDVADCHHDEGPNTAHRKGGCMLARYYGLNRDQRKELLGHIDENKDKFYNLSLRLVGQAAICYKQDPDGWKADLEATKMRTR